MPNPCHFRGLYDRASPSPASSGVRGERGGRGGSPQGQELSDEDDDPL